MKPPIFIGGFVMLYLPFPAVTQDEKFAASPPIVGRMAFREGQISNQRVILYEGKFTKLYNILHNAQ